MKYEWRTEMCKNFWFESLKRKAHSEDLYVDEKIMMMIITTMMMMMTKNGF
jgi:hypothetical protein